MKDDVCDTTLGRGDDDEWKLSNNLAVKVTETNATWVKDCLKKTHLRVMYARKRGLNSIKADAS